MGEDQFVRYGILFAHFMGSKDGPGRYEDYMDISFLPDKKTVAALIAIVFFVFGYALGKGHNTESVPGLPTPPMVASEPVIPTVIAEPTATTTVVVVPTVVPTVAPTATVVPIDEAWLTEWAKSVAVADGYNKRYNENQWQWMVDNYIEAFHAVADICNENGYEVAALIEELAVGQDDGIRLALLAAIWNEFDDKTDIDCEGWLRERMENARNIGTDNDGE